MLLRNVERAIRRELLELQYDDYLTRIFMICFKASQLYRDRMSSEYAQLVDETFSILLTLSRETLPVTAESPLVALGARWSKAADEGIGGTGQSNLTFTFENICEELLGNAPRYEGASRVLVPFTDLPGVGHIPTSRGVRRVDNREVDPDGPLFRLLEEVRHIVSGDG